MPGDFKGTVLKNIPMGGYMLAQYEQLKNIIFWIFLKSKLLYAYAKNTLYGEINTKSVYISVNNNTN